jgi:hypothetical protein
MTNSNKIEVIEADNFSNETKYRMTIEHEGEKFYWIGFLGEYGSVEEWYDLAERKIQEPDWADSMDLWELCDEKSKQNEKSFDWLCTKILEICPSASFDQDNDGQIIIYTGLTEDETGTLNKLEVDNA